jgi:hypothetical protein
LTDNGKNPAAQNFTAGAELFHAGRQTHRRDPIPAAHNFVNVPNKEQAHVILSAGMTVYTTAIEYYNINNNNSYLNFFVVIVSTHVLSQFN